VWRVVRRPRNGSDVLRVLLDAVSHAAQRRPDMRGRSLRCKVQCGLQRVQRRMQSGGREELRSDMRSLHRARPWGCGVQERDV
jgi:hypothetical protein